MAFFDYNLKQELQKLGLAEYNRRSSSDREDKQMRSNEGQHEDIRTDIIEPLNLNNVILLQESQSAFKKGREQFAKLIDLIESGTVQVVLVWHANRISRNYSDGGRFVQLMADGKLKYVITPNGLFGSTPRDQEYLMNEFTRATRDSGDKSDAVKRGYRTKLKSGYMPAGRLAEGFIHAKNIREEFINIADPERLPLIQEAIQLVINQTHTPLEAFEHLNNKGYRTKKTKRTGGKALARSTWYKLLSDPKYFYGEIRRSEGIFMGGDGIPRPFTKEDFEKIQIILGTKGTRRKTKKDWAYDGNELVCGCCGSGIIMDEKWHIVCSICHKKFHKGLTTTSCPDCKTPISEMRNPTIRHYIWLVSSKKKLKPDGTRCTQPSLPVKDFEKTIDSLLENIEIPKSFTDWAIKWLQTQNEVEVDERTDTKRRLQSFDNDIQSQIDKLLELLLKGVISPEEYQPKKESLLLEQQSIRRNLLQTDGRADNWLELTEKTFNFAFYARYWFTNGTTEQKRTILRTLGSNLKLNGQILSIDQYKPFILIKNIKEKYGVLLEKFEPQEWTDKSIQTESSDPTNPNLLRDMDSNHDKQIQSLLSYH